MAAGISFDVRLRRTSLMFATEYFTCCFLLTKAHFCALSNWWQKPFKANVRRVSCRLMALASLRRNGIKVSTP